ncbi:unnamed protein product [Camellia sinensis]
MVLAVKKINSSALPNHLFEDFMDIVSDVSRLRHPNITEFVGYCSEQDSTCCKPLTWNTRVKIALGTARAQIGEQLTS